MELGHARAFAMHHQGVIRAEFPRDSLDDVFASVLFESGLDMTLQFGRAPIFISRRLGAHQRQHQQQADQFVGHSTLPIH